MNPTQLHQLAKLVGPHADIAVSLDDHGNIAKARIKQPAHRKTLAPEATT